MQVNNPDFFTPPGSGSSAPRENSRDGLFDTLLREEEARYENAPPPASERGDDYRDDHRRDDHRDDYRADDHHRDRDRDEPPVGRDDSGDDEGWQDDDGEPVVAADAPPGDEADVPEGQNQASPGEQPKEPAEQPNSTADAGSKTEGESPGTEAGAGSQGVAGTAPATDSTAAQAANVPTTPAVPGAATSQTISSGVAASASQTAATNASPTQAVTQGAAAAAQGAGNPTKPAAKENTAEKTAPLAAAKQTAAAQPSQPTAQNTGGTANTAQPSSTTEDLSVTVTNAGLTSRPSAALGGAAATTVLAEEAKPGTPALNNGNPAKKKAGQPGTPAIGAQSNPSAQGAKPGHMTDSATSGPTAGTDKTAGEVRAPGPLGSGAPGATGGNAQMPSTSPAAPGLSGGSVQNASFADSLTTARGSSSSAPAEQIAVQVHKASAAGKEQINIKLHPAELGRVEVKMENGTDGVLRAVISAERSETLDLLQRDARGLERALQEAGVKTDSGSLSFNLKGQQQPGQEQSGGQASAQPDGVSGEPDESMAPPPASAALSGHDGALDIRV
ncbi:hypothetical protein HBA54_12830 [Pelagibius litoralis]|uniref:Flagellar hook-length control protein-like C-terminal domain-containing protein n=1 Tax=Pelagibius litoralis TaxID=374515 RepID=A0A967K6V7_9PROT|nr:flagellar hook-length control protein FliK [Pelagibius litoralis]NIA69478.1 hypothetical protein [Pelagibius litoralis]